MAQAGTIPTSIKDETGAIARREAAANDAMAKMFYALMARREDRLRAEALQMKMFGLRNAEWDRRDAITSSRTGQPAYTPSYGAQDGSMGTATPAAPANDGSTIGDTPILNPDTFSMNTSGGSNTMVGGAGMDAMAQASPADAAAAKADAKVHPSGAAKAPTTSLPAARRKPAPQVVFRGVTPEVLAEWSKAEKQYGVPQGQLLMTYGMETSGGQNRDNPDPNIGPKGPFQWTPQLLRQNGLTTQDAYDLVKMGYATAKNMAHNHSELVRRTTLGGKAVQLTDSVNDMRSWHWLHQFGVKGGPALVAAVKLNPTMKMVDVLNMLGLKDANGKPVDFGRVLISNGYGGETTIAEGQQILDSKMHPWRTAAVQGKGLDTSGQPTQQSQAAPAGPQVAGGAPNVQNVGPLRAIRTDTQASQLTPQAGRAMQQLLSEFPNIRVGSTYRGGNPDSQHYHRTAFDADFSRLSVPEKIAATRRAVELGAIGIGNYGNDSMHFDWRTGWPKVAWGPNRSYTSLHQAAPWFQQIAHNHRNNRPVGPSGVGTQVAQAPQAAKPTEASSQVRKPLTEYPRPSPKPSETNADVTGGNIFAGAAVTPKSAVAAAPPQQAPQAPQAPGAAQAKPTPTPPALPPGIRPNQSYNVQSQQQPYAPDPTTVPQDLPFEANYPAPPQSNVPMPPRKPVNMQDVATEALSARGQMQPTELAFMHPMMFGGAGAVEDTYGAVGNQDYGDFGTHSSAAVLNVPMPRARPQDGAQSFDEAGMQMYEGQMAMPTGNEFEPPVMAVPQGNEYAADVMAMPEGNEYAPTVMATPGVAEYGGDAMAMPAGNEYAPDAMAMPAGNEYEQPNMAVPEGNEYAPDVMAAAPGNEFEVPNMAAAAGNEYAPPRGLPGANLTMPTRPFGMQERRQGAQAPPVPLPADYMTLQQRLGWPSGEERFKMQNDVRNALFNTMKQPFNAGTDAANVGGMPKAPPFDTSQSYPPVADIPLPPEGGGDASTSAPAPAPAGPQRLPAGYVAMGDQARSIRDALFNKASEPAKPNPVHGIARPYVDNVLQSILAKAKEYQQSVQATTPPTAASAPNAAAIIRSVFGAGKQAFTQPMPQFGNIQFGSPAQGAGDAEAPIPMSRRGAAPPPQVTSQPQQAPQPRPQQAPSAEQDMASVVSPQTLIDVFKRTAPGYAAQGIGKGYNAISEMFKSKPSAATAKPSPAAAPLAGKPVKVERFRNGLPVGSDDKIEIPPMPGRATTSTTPIPYDTAAPAAGGAGGAAKPPTPAAPKAGAGAGAKNSYRSWRMPDGSMVYTKPGEDPPAGAQQVK